MTNKNKDSRKLSEDLSKIDINIDLTPIEDVFFIDDYAKEHSEVMDAGYTSSFMFNDALSQLSEKYSDAMRDALLETPDYNDEKAHLRAMALTGGLSDNISEQIKKEINQTQESSQEAGNQRKESKDDKKKSEKDDKDKEPAIEKSSSAGGPSLAAGLSEFSKLIGSGMSVFSKKRKRAENPENIDGHQQIVTHEVILQNQKMRNAINNINQKNALASITYQNMMKELNNPELNFDWEKGLNDIQQGKSTPEAIEISQNTAITNSIKEHDLALIALAQELSPDNLKEAKSLMESGFMSKDLKTKYTNSIEDSMLQLEKNTPSLFELGSNKMMESFEDMLNSLKSLFGFKSSGPSSGMSR